MDVRAGDAAVERARKAVLGRRVVRVRRGEQRAALGERELVRAELARLEGEPSTEATPSDSECSRRPEALPKGREGDLPGETEACGFFLLCMSDDSLPIFLPAAPADSLGEPRALREPFCPSTYSISRCLR